MLNSLNLKVVIKVIAEAPNKAKNKPLLNSSQVSEYTNMTPEPLKRQLHILACVNSE